MKIGYARVSTKGQNLSLQLDALEQYGCEKIFTDKISGAEKERKGLNQALEYARKGDTLVVWKLDRAGRSLKHLIELVNNLNEKEIGFVSLKENINTTTSTGKLIFHIFASLAEFERDIIKERTQAGLAAARARGRLGGRPSIDPDTINKAIRLYESGNFGVNEILKMTGISKATLYRYLKERKVNESI